MTTYNLKTDSAQIYNDLGIAGLSESDYEVTIKKIGKQRTLTQNAAIHKYCELLALALNENGHYQTRKIANIEIELPWTMIGVKVNIWHPIQLHMYPERVDSEGNPSTAELETNEVSEVYKWISMNVAQVRGIDIPFPSAR